MAATNITAEEQRRLEKLRLNQSLSSLTYKTNDDRDNVEVTVAPNAPGGAEGLEQRMDQLGLTGNTKNMAMSLSAALMSNKPQSRALVMTEARDPFANGSLDWFGIDLTKDTVADMIGTQLDPNANADAQRRFASFKFSSDAMKKQTFKDLVLYTYMKCLAPFTDAEAQAAFVDARDAPTARTRLQERRNRQIAALLQAMGGMNTAKTINEQQKNISQEVENKIIRKNNLGVLGKDLVCAPLTTGLHSSAPPEVLKSLSTNISNIPFGSPHNNKPLRFFLTQVAGIINGNYNEKGAYHILSSVMTGAPHELVQNNSDNEISFEACWMDLQMTYRNFGQSTEGIMAQIKNCMRTRPTDVSSAVGQLRNLVIKKNKFREPAERELITNSEAKDLIFSLLNIWYPTYVPTIRAQFESINTHASDHGYKTLPAPIQLSMLVTEHIKNAPAITQKYAELHAMSISHPDAISEEGICRDTVAYLAQGGPEFYAFNSNYQQNGGKPLNIPDHLRDRCLKCAGHNHLYKNCPKYPGEMIGQTICGYCGGKHSSKCKNLEISQLDASQVDTRGDYYEEPKSQHLWHPGNQQ